jgi:glycosyltransferase involved in cell wall biosynthesis
MMVRVVVDALPVTGSSLGRIIHNMLLGWEQLDTRDELHVVTTPLAQMTIPKSMTPHILPIEKRYKLRRTIAQNTVVPKLCRQVGADVMLGVIPATTLVPLPCPRSVILYDLRHELRPDQFSREARILRVSYNLGLRQADAIASISNRTTKDLLRSRPWIDPSRVSLAYLAADQADSWPRPSTPVDPPYAIGFGQYANKNVGMLLEAWAILRDRGLARPLQLCGIPDSDREAIVGQISRLGLSDLVTPLGWIPSEELHARFAAAGLVVFPSDFEGFGMPAAEAMRLGIPLVISPDPALVEVAGGHATLMADWGPAPLADAIVAAWETPPEQLAAAKAFASRYTWSNMAAGVRRACEIAVAGGSGPLLRRPSTSALVSGSDRAAGR